MDLMNPESCVRINDTLDVLAPFEVLKYTGFQ